METQGTIIATFFPISSDHYEIPELEHHLDTSLELSFSGYTQQKCHDWGISDGPIATQTFSAWHWVLWRTRHFGHIRSSTWRHPKDTCNDFYPIKYKRGNEEKILRLQNDGEDFTVSCKHDKFPITSIQQASDCFRSGKMINHLKRICGPETQSSASVNTFNTEYSSSNSLSPSEDKAADLTSPGDDSNHVSTDSEDDNIVCDISIQADQARLCQAKHAHNLVLGKTDASLVKKLLTTSDAPHLNTKALIQKLDEVAKTAYLDVSTILEEQMKDPVLGPLHSWIRKTTTPDIKSLEIQQSKCLLRYCQEFNRLLIEEEEQLLCHNEPSDKLEEENLHICLPVSPFLACFQLGHYNEMCGHMGATKTYANAKRFDYWPGMFDWICASTADCLTCQNNKLKPKHRHEVPLEEWQNETIPFRTIHIDQKGPIHPTSASIVHCHLIVDAFSRFLMVYPVRNTTTLATITAFEKWILFLESHNELSLIEVLPLSIQSSPTGPKNLELL